MELKKRFKKEDCTISKIYACYVNLEGEIKCFLNENFLVMKDNRENDFFKFLEIQKKNISNKLSMIDLEESSDIKKLLDSLNKGNLSDINLINTLIDKIKDAYLKDSLGNFIITLISDSYDVPARTSDGIKIDESEEVYQYIMCSICPVNLSKAGLAYLEEKNTLGSRIQDQVADAPIIGFLYPSFIDKSSDDRFISYLYKSEKNLFPSISSDLFDASPNIEEEIKKEPTKVTDSYLEETLPELEKESIIPDNLPEYLKKEHDEIFEDAISTEKTNSSSEKIKNSSEEYDEEEYAGFCKTSDYEISSDNEEDNNHNKNNISDKPLDDLIENINKLLEENKNKAEIQIINGKKYLMVPID